MTQITMIDPSRITDRLFGGPYFRRFNIVGGNRVACPNTGDVWDIRGLSDAWMEGRNLAPIIKGGEGRQ